MFGSQKLRVSILVSEFSLGVGLSFKGFMLVSQAPTVTVIPWHELEREL